MELSTLREEIDRLDQQLVQAFQARMRVCADVAEYKREHKLPVLDAARERAKLVNILEGADADLRDYLGVLYSEIFELSRSWQDRLLAPASDLPARIEAALAATPKLLPELPLVACQGVEGAYSQHAAEKFFRLPNIMYFESFEGVFAAIDNDLCTYGVLPVENSTAGSVNKIYDLMMRYNFSIVRSLRLKIDHSLLAKPGVTLPEIREIFSHEQAINQSAGFLKSLGSGVKVTACANTAVAARMVAESDRRDVAALSSRDCAQLYGLKALASSVQDQGNNYTRFICISKQLEIYPGADRTSIMLTIPHKPGSLYRILSRFNSLGINLTKLESRPIPDRDFEFMFYFDLETPVYSPAFLQLMGELDHLCETFRYLGSYTELV